MSKDIVARGYNLIAKRYAEWSAQVRVEERDRYTNRILNGLPFGASVLEIGCGSGDPTTMRLAQRLKIVGIDISERQIELARRNVPTASFILGDITTSDFSPSSFDAVIGFYSLIHIPRDEQPRLLRSISAWLKPGGLFVASMSVHSDEGDIEENWLGEPMFFSGFDSLTNNRLVQEAGLDILSAVEETADEFGSPTTFLWIVAQKPQLCPDTMIYGTDEAVGRLQ